MYENTFPNKRFKHTVAFLKKHVNSSQSILDLGIENPLSDILKSQGYTVDNTSGTDLDFNTSEIEDSKADVVTAFEIFEHMFAPFNVLRQIKANKLIASVPLKLWFANAYWNKHDEWDRHYHEFEKKQFDFLLKKTGWKIIDSEQWVAQEKFKFGFRPILRMFTPRYYIVYCERN